MPKTKMPSGARRSRRGLLGGGIMRSGSSDSGDRTRSAYRSPPAGRSSASTGAGLRTGGSFGGDAREPRGGFLALQPAQAGFKPLEILVGHDLVTARGGWRPTVRIGSGLQRGGRFRIDGVFPGGLARRAQRMVAVVALAEQRALHARGRVVGAQIGSIEDRRECRSVAKIARALRPARAEAAAALPRTWRQNPVHRRMVSALASAHKATDRDPDHSRPDPARCPHARPRLSARKAARRMIVALGRMSFRDLARPVRHVSAKIDGARRLS